MKKTLDDGARGNRGSTPQRQPPPVRKVIPKPFRRQKQSFDYGDAPVEHKRMDSETHRSFDSGDKNVDTKGADDDNAKSGDNKSGDRDYTSSNDPNIINNGTVKIIDHVGVVGSTEGSAQRRRGPGSRDRSKCIYMADNGRQYSRGMFCSILNLEKTYRRSRPRKVVTYILTLSFIHAKVFRM